MMLNWDILLPEKPRPSADATGAGLPPYCVIHAVDCEEVSKKNVQNSRP